MTDSKVWFVTGAGRGLGAAIAKAALDAGHRVVATARNPQAVTDSLGEHENLLAVALDITDPAQVQAAVASALDRFSTIDVLVNNAGYGQLGFFEETSEELVRRQFETNVFGTLDVTRAVLPILRAKKNGRIFTVSSIAGFNAVAGGSIYSASKFAVDGWMEGLAEELRPLGIRTTVVEPGFFNTDFLDPTSAVWGEATIAEYAEAATAFRAWHDEKNHDQEGDPAKLAAALLQLADDPDQPVRWAAGADAVAVSRDRIAKRIKDLDDYEALSSSLAQD